MQSISSNASICFICRQTNPELKHFSTTENPYEFNLKKTLKELILHVTDSTHLDFNILEEILLCPECAEDLKVYDNCMVNLKNVQKRLTNNISKWSISCKSSGTHVLNKKLEITNIPTQDYFPSTNLDEYSKNSEQFFFVKIANENTNETIKLENEEYQDFLQLKDNLYQNTTIGKEIELKKATKRKPSKCVFCNEVFKNKKILNQHMNEVHKFASNKTCLICNFIAKNEEYLDLHMNIHNGKTERECRYCSKQYTTKKSVIRHMEKHWNKNKFQCEKCGVFFSESIILYNHKLQHEAEEQPLICEICNQSFKTKRTYKGHILKHREDRPRFNCTICSKTFVEKYTLKVHMRTHNDNYEISKRKNMVKIGKHIEKQDAYTCIICSYKLTTKDLYNQHMEKKHDVIF